MFNVAEVKFLGHVLTKDGVKIDPDKVVAIQALNQPKDKKQLQRLLGPIHTAPARLQKILYDVMPYVSTVKYVEGSDLHIADALSRDCDQTDETDETDESEDAIVHAVLSMSDETTNRYVKAMENDVELRELTKLTHEGWPENVRSMSPKLKHYRTFKEEIEWVDGLLFKGEKLIFSVSERPKCLESNNSTFSRDTRK